VQSDRMRLRIGLVGMGLEAYWRQFDGLKERLSATARRNIAIASASFD
jgi:hypothetical protein